jgi:hypothetical protein
MSDKPLVIRHLNAKLEAFRKLLKPSAISLNLSNLPKPFQPIDNLKNRFQKPSIPHQRPQKNVNSFSQNVKTQKHSRRLISASTLSGKFN